VVAGWVVVLLAGAVAVVRLVGEEAHPDDPGPFYDQPEALPDGPLGAVVRREVIADFHPGATAYRVLYTSTDTEGQRRAVSGVVAIPDGPAPAGGRKIVVYTHGTVGVAARCGPSMQAPADQPLFFEGGAALLDAGYIVAAPDYEGLGTAGPHPYLVGAAEARNALDSARAARQLAGDDAGTDFVVWGHSQGGHASLFTGELAATYAPELHLVGVAAGAPPSDLIALFRTNVKTTAGKVLVAMAIHSWAGVFHDASLDQIVAPVARPVVRDISRNCLYGTHQLLKSVPGSLALNVRFLSNPPWETEPWRTIARSNQPGGDPIGAPVLLVQGDADTIIPAALTRDLADRLCASGEEVELRILAGAPHVETGHLAAPDVVTWIGDRFAGRTPASTC
jgi:fermentation-respiration switch protein FrsA (DUF1100 family)